MKDLSVNAIIKRKRESMGITQARLAEMMGLKRSTYARKEVAGLFTANDIKKLSVLLDVDPFYLLFGEKSPKKIPNEIVKEIEKGLRKKIEDEVREEYVEKYPFIGWSDDNDIACFDLIAHLRKFQRRHILHYAHKIYRKQIKVQDVEAMFF